MGLLAGTFMRLVCGNLTLFCGGPVVAGRTVSDRHFLETFFKVSVRSLLVPRNTSTKTGSGRKVLMIQPTSVHGVG